MKIQTERFFLKDNIYPAIAYDGWQMGKKLKLFDLHYVCQIYGQYSTCFCVKLCDDCIVVDSTKYYFTDQTSDLYDNRHACAANGIFFVKQTAMALKSGGQDNELDDENSVILSYALVRGKEDCCMEFTIYFEGDNAPENVKGSAFAAIFGDNYEYEPAHENFSTFLAEMQARE